MTTRKRKPAWWIEQDTDGRIEGVKRAQEVLHARHFGINVPFEVVEQAIWEATLTAEKATAEKEQGA